MKFNQVTALAAAAIIIPLSGTVAHFANAQSVEAESVSPARTERQARGRGGKGGQLFEQLNLTDEQKAEIQQIRQEARQNWEGKREEMRTARQKMRDLYASDASADQLRAQREENLSLRQEFGEQRFETKLKVREVLTLEQRQQLVELKGQRRGRRGPRGLQSVRF